MNWQPPENRQCKGERGRREVAKRGFGSPQAVAQMKRGKWYCVYKPHPAVNVRGFINPIRRLGVKEVLDRRGFENR